MSNSSDNDFQYSINSIYNELPAIGYATRNTNQDRKRQNVPSNVLIDSPHDNQKTSRQELLTYQLRYRGRSKGGKVRLPTVPFRHTSLEKNKKLTEPSCSMDNIAYAPDIQVTGSTEQLYVKSLIPRIKTQKENGQQLWSQFDNEIEHNYVMQKCPWAKHASSSEESSPRNPPPVSDRFAGLMRSTQNINREKLKPKLRDSAIQTDNIKKQTKTAFTDDSDAENRTQTPEANGSETDDDEDDYLDPDIWQRLCERNTDFYTPRTKREIYKHYISGREGIRHLLKQDHTNLHKKFVAALDDKVIDEKLYDNYAREYPTIEEEENARKIEEESKEKTKEDAIEALLQCKPRLGLQKFVLIREAPLLRSRSENDEHDEQNCDVRQSSDVKSRISIYPDDDMLPKTWDYKTRPTSMQSLRKSSGKSDSSNFGFSCGRKAQRSPCYPVFGSTLDSPVRKLGHVKSRPKSRKDKISNKDRKSPLVTPPCTSVG